MCSDTPSPYIVQELPDITESINYPIKDVQRIKYSCFDVSKSLIAFGATSGGVYIFNRTPCEFVQLIPNKGGTITRLAISPNEKHIAFANGRGIVTVTAYDQSLNSGHMTSKEHQGNEVTTMIWAGNNLFTGDDVGRISVLQLQSFITKKMLTSSSQTIMTLDSRICQLDVKGCMLLVSTLSRCYICDTAQEQYRQIGQKPRDGEFGACFLTKEQNTDNGPPETKAFSEAKKYTMFSEDDKFAVGKDLENVLIYCARPSSRLWEATIDGTVKRTHQFKHVLARNPMKVVTVELYNNETFTLDDLGYGEGQSLNFSRIFNIKNCIFSFTKNGLYFLDVQDERHSMWFDAYKDIVDCKIYHDNLYLWMSNGSVVSLKFTIVDNFLMKCYLDEKYTLCAKMCALFRDYLLQYSSPKLNILGGLRGKIKNESNELLLKIENILVQLESNKTEAQRSGIYVLDNNFRVQSSLDDASGKLKQNDDTVFTSLPPEALQTLKDLSASVTDKLSSSKKIIKEKWEDFEGKMKHLNNDKHTPQDFNLPKRLSPEESTEQKQSIDFDNNDVIYSKESSQKSIIDVENKLENDNANEVCKALYQHFRLSLVGKETNQSNLISIIKSHACDINEIYQLMLLLEKYCLTIGALEESKFVPNHIFLSYINLASQKDNILDSIIKNEVLYNYFVDSCISVNIKSQFANLGCDCGFPLPFNGTHEMPAFFELIDAFIEKQWAIQTLDQCYEVCRKMPYLWRKILYLRRNEDLLNVLRLLLQMLDESLLHSFLPQFTFETWDRAIQLYATLFGNRCLYCHRKFNHISVKETLSWDDFGALIIKSVGGKNAIRLTEKHACLINAGELTTKFYHTCIFVALFEKYDSTISARLTDSLYSSYEFADSRDEICSYLRSIVDGQINNTALPIIVAAKTIHWGLKPLTEKVTRRNSDASESEVYIIRNANLSEIVRKLHVINNGVTDCALCGLPLQNEVLIEDGGLWAFQCGHIFHGACLNINNMKLCPACILSNT